MAALVYNLFLLLVFLKVCCCGYTEITAEKKYRFDYDWSDEAGGWLKYHAVPAIWHEARLRCIAEGAILASPLTEKLRTAIVRFVKKYSHSESHIFTGVHSIFSRGDYTSIEGVPLLKLAITWQAGEPDNFNNTERCLAMLISHTEDDGAMSDTSCERVLPYVCYENDILPNITECGTTDHAYIKDNRTGSCYKFHERGLPWSEAYMTCVAEGGHLAVANSDVEAAVVKEFISKRRQNAFAYSKEFIYIGYRDWGHAGTNFMTIFGDFVESHFTWEAGEPNNSTNSKVGMEGESCGSLLTNFRLNDYFCYVPTGFLCEKEPKSLELLKNENLNTLPLNKVEPNLPRQTNNRTTSIDNDINLHLSTSNDIY